MGGGMADEILSLEPILDHRRHDMASFPIPEELMVEIFLRLPSPADLTRASAACVSFRRVAADSSFLRRYRKLHAPPVLGFLDLHNVFYPATPPYHSASAAKAVYFAADFSFSFLPAPVSYWVVRDICDGRVVLDRSNWMAPTVLFPEVVVCDPLHLRYLLLPPITDSVEDPLWIGALEHTDIFLVPPVYVEETGTADETSFTVIWMAQCKTRLVTFVFASNSGQWRAVSSWRWSDLFVGLQPLPVSGLFYSRHYMYGCFYWLTLDCEESKLLVLDTKMMEFSTADSPPEANGCFDFAMVEAGEGRPGMFVLADNRSDLSYFIGQNDGWSSIQWQKMKTISLGSGVLLMCNMEKYLLLQHLESSVLEPDYSTLDIETFQLAKVSHLGFTSCKLHTYSNFPPSLLSSPTISSGVAKRA